jgi:hypothetical protein
MVEKTMPSLVNNLTTSPPPVAGVFSRALMLEFTLTTLVYHVKDRAPGNDCARERNLEEGIDEVDHIQEC